MTAGHGQRGRFRAGRAALAMVVAASACTTVVGLEDELAGSWRWVGSQGGIAGRVLTPASEGYTVRFELDDDGVARAFRNDSLVATVRFTLMERLSLVTPGSDPEYEIRFEPPLAAFLFGTLEQATVRRSDGSGISLVEPCCDRYQHDFEKQSGTR